MNYRYAIVSLLCYGALHAMELDTKDCKQEVGKKSRFEMGYYNNDYITPKNAHFFPEEPEKNSIGKPYIPEDKEEKTTCCSLFMIFLNSWNNSHGFLYPVSSFPK